MKEKVAEKSIIEPHWLEWSRHRFAAIPSGYRDWLLDEGSLTRRVMLACADRQFRVRLLHQGWLRPLYSEGRVLRLRRGGMTLIREVELVCDQTPWVFARTVIPATSLKGSARRLKRLGEKPLGAVLFSHSKLRRGITQVARLSPRHPLYDAATVHVAAKPNELWGRRTLFYLSGRPILVNEIFLPDIPQVGGR
ncbi:MAG: chorismate lyase [Chromatiales bacterium]